MRARLRPLCRYTTWNVTLSGPASVRAADVAASLSSSLPMHKQAPLATATATVTNTGAVQSDYVVLLFQVRMQKRLLVCVCVGGRSVRVWGECVCACASTCVVWGACVCVCVSEMCVCGCRLPVQPGANPVPAGSDPIKSLVGFARVNLAPGASTTVPLPLDATAFSRVNADGQRVVNAEEWRFTVDGEMLSVRVVA